VVNIGILSFNNGEVTEHIDARSDVDKYSSSCRTLENLIPLVWGDVTRRPGTQYIADTKNDGAARLIPFIYSATIAYQCEFGAGYIRFFYNKAPLYDASVVDFACTAATSNNRMTIPAAFMVTGTPFVFTSDAVPTGLTKGTTYYITDPVYFESVYSAQMSLTQFGPPFQFASQQDLACTISGGVIVEVSTPYGSGDLAELQYKQLGDTMWLVHPDYPPAKLTRTTTTSFAYTPIVFNQGPFLTRNDIAHTDTTDPLTGVALTSSVTDPGQTGTLTSTSPVFTSTDVGSLWSLTLPVTVPQVNIKLTSTNLGISDPIDIKGTWTFTTHGTWTGTVLIQRSDNGGQWDTFRTYTSDNDANFTLSETETDDDIRYRINMTSHDSGTFKADLATDQSTQDGVVRVTGYVSPTVVDITVVSQLGNDNPVVLNTISGGSITTTGNHNLNTGDMFSLTPWYRVADPTTSTAAWNSTTRTITKTGVFSTLTYQLGQYIRLQDSSTGTWVMFPVESKTSDDAVVLTNVSQLSLLGSTNTSTSVSGVFLNGASFKVDSVTSTTEFTYKHLDGSALTTAEKSLTQDLVLVITLGTLRWAQGAWSDTLGYPRAVAWYDDRIVYSGQVKSLATLWFSAVDDFENFEAGVLDAQSFSLTLATCNEIRWVEALDLLCVGTSGDEWTVGSNKLGVPISPTNFVDRSQSTYGSSAIQPARTRKALLFVDYVGRRVHEMTYSFADDKYVAPDLTRMAEHVTESGLVAQAMQMNPDSILWAVRGDGTLISFTYERDENVLAWARHPMETQ
jgi:hypothetical protein